MKNPVLVTGATGTVGKELVDQLLSRGTRVRAMLHDPKKADAYIGTEVELAIGDLSDPDDVRRALELVEKVYLLTPVSNKMVEQTKLMCEEAERAGVRRIVKQSIINCDSAPGEFSRLHHEAERVLRRSLVSHTMIRPNQFMQNFVNFYSAEIKAHDALIKPCGTGRTSFVDARDVATAATVVLDGNWHDGKTYTITGPEAMSNSEAAVMLSQVVGRTITFVDVAPEEYRKGMLDAGMSTWLVDGMMDVLRSERESLAEKVSPDFTRLTGVRPRGFANFAKDHRAAFIKS